MSDTFESKAEAEKEGPAQRWKDELDLAEKEERDWVKRAEKVIERYRDEKRGKGRRFNILWANVETLKPTIFSQAPTPVVRRRYLDQDPVGRQVADILQRSLAFLMDEYDFVRTIEHARDDMLLAGRGIIRVEYEAGIDKKTPEKMEDGTYSLAGMPVEPTYAEDDADQANPYVERKGEEYARCCYVYWKDFRMSPARTWEDVRWVAFRKFPTREDLIEQFGDKGREVNLTHSVGDDSDKKDPKDAFKRAVVWEIWDKDSKKRLYVSDGYDGILKEDDDPLGLDGFFPMPEPIQAVGTTDNMVPIPEFTIYQDQADEVDQTTQRIDRLMAALKVRGFYAGQLKALPDLLRGDDNEIHPVDDWAMIQQLGGLQNAITYMDIKPIGEVAMGLAEHRERVKQEIYEITGISDIVRGSTKKEETATAQNIKGQYAQVRMTPRQKPMQRFIRDILRLKAEIVAEHFSPENIAKMTGREVPLEVMSVLREQKTRDYRIDIETDSTVAPDEQAEKAQITEFLTSITGFLQAALEIVGAEPLMAPMMLEFLKTMVRRYRIGAEMEDVIEQTSAQIIQKAQNPQPPPPDPNMVKAQADVEMKKAELGMKREEHAMNMQAKQAEMQIDMQGKVMNAQVDQQIAQQRMQSDAEKHAMHLEQQRQRALVGAANA